MKREVTAIPFITFVFVVFTSAYGGHYLITQLGEIWTMMILCLVSLAFHGCVIFVCKKDITLDKIIDRVDARIRAILPKPKE